MWSSENQEHTSHTVDNNKKKKRVTERERKQRKQINDEKRVCVRHIT